MNAYINKLKEYSLLLANIVQKAKKFSRGDSVSWNSSGGRARGKITRVITSGSTAVPNTSFTISGTEDNPGALIRVYRPDNEGKYKPTDTIVGHRFNTLTKIEALD